MSISEVIVVYQMLINVLFLFIQLKDKDLGELSEWLQAKREDCDVHLTEEVVEAKVEDISTTEMMQATYEEVEILPEPEEEVVFQDELVEEVRRIF